MKTNVVLVSASLYARHSKSADWKDSPMDGTCKFTGFQFHVPLLRKSFNNISHRNTAGSCDFTWRLQIKFLNQKFSSLE